MPGCVWIPNRNIRFQIGKGKGEPESEGYYESGSPDGFVFATLHKRLKPFAVCIECKAALGVVPFGTFRPNQENWEKNIHNVTSVLYYLALAVYSHRTIEGKSDASLWHLYLFPISEWYKLRGETWTQHGSKSIPLNSDLRKGEEWSDFYLDKQLSPWGLIREKQPIFKNGTATWETEWRYKIPDNHPLWRDYKIGS